MGIDRVPARGVGAVDKWAARARLSAATLASILALAEGARRDKGAGDTGALCAQIKMVAGNRSHHDLRRIDELAAQVKVVAGERNQLALLFRAAA